MYKHIGYNVLRCQYFESSGMLISPSIYSVSSLPDHWEESDHADLLHPTASP